MTEKWTNVQIERAMKVSFDDMLMVGYDLERLAELAKSSDNEFYIGDADTALSIVSRFIASPERDRKELIRFGKCLKRLHEWALMNNDALGAILVTKIQKTMIGE